MRGTKAKRLRKAGLKPIAQKRELTEGQVKAQERRIAEAKEPYQRQRDRRAGKALEGIYKDIAKALGKKQEEEYGND